ncbi:MAG: AgmX/PglI C-terminal domain-containing protein [Deltaproteobacteria bacterium]|nr:AgmX/PglI C-terminal domain-containing protein [Deltaproteobacteria bacterium]
MPAPEPAAEEPWKSQAEDDQVVWYLAQRGQQSPPLTRARISNMIRNREVNDRAYAWNQTLPNWQRITELRAFAADFEWLRQQEADGKVVDFQKRVAELKRQQNRVQRQQAVEALDQIADMVQTAKPVSAAPAAVPSLSPKAMPASSDLSGPDEWTALTPHGKARVRQGLVTASPEARHAPGQPPAQVSTRTEQEDEASFFDPSSVQSLGDAAVIVTDPSPEVSARMRAAGIPTINATPFDPFAFVPDVPESKEPPPPRESTRVFLQRVGLSGRRRLVKIVAAAGVVVLLLSVTIALDVFGLVRVPMLHGYIESIKERRAEVALDETELEERLTREEQDTISQALRIGDLALADKVRQQARHRAGRKKTGKPHPLPDLSDQVRGGGSAIDDPARRGGGQQQQIELSQADKEALAGLVKRGDTKQVAIQIKPGLNEIRLPKRHQGGLTSNQIGVVVSENQEGIKRCATAETKYGLELPPAITVAIKIDRSGAVTHAVANEAKYRNSQLARCLVSMVRKWRFPEFTGEPMEVEIPFKFATTM